MRTLTNIVFGLLLASAHAACAGGAAPEDLSATRLPNAVGLLPLSNTAAAEKGYILRFADKHLGEIPASVAEAHPPLPDEAALKEIQSKKAGDIFYRAADAGTFHAISGRISDLGPGFLADFGGRDLPEPAVATSKEQRTLGAIDGVQVGHVYLVKAVDGGHALVRFLERTDDGAVVQFVYRADGALDFPIPKALAAPVAPATTQAGPRAAAFDLDKPEAFFAERDKLVAALLARVQASGPDMWRLEQAELRERAIATLGRLKAEEAIPVLFREINFSVPDQAGTKFVKPPADQLPCVKALGQIGKPASARALEELAKLSGAPEDQVRRIEFKIPPLVAVLRGVEGKDVAVFLLRRDSNAAEPAHRAVYKLALEVLSEE